ncbi:MAG: hypothetical protein RBG13Loki_3364 [Promethearchaeota archaeon CR_4]|nr:MAG: hypothetical protein RBG13Loki_3364 [Candidatus Lokiarchaeota archaeon CR_4]
MPKILVELASPLSIQIKWRKREFEVDSLQQVVSILHATFPVEMRNVYFEPDSQMPKSYLLFFLNHEDIRRKEGFDTALHNGDLLQVAIALGGG